MTDNFNDAIAPEEMDDDGIITMVDDEGNEVEFEFLDHIEYQDAEYVVLMPTDDDSGEVLILQLIQESDDEDTFAGIDDDDILAAVFGIFKERHKDIFTFRD